MRRAGIPSRRGCRRPGAGPGAGSALAVTVAVALLVPQSAGAGPLGTDEGLITVTGATTVEAAYYDVSGDRSGGLYRALGGASYGQLNLAFDWRRSPYFSVWGEFRALVNDSPYRSDLDGSQIELARLLIENGEGPLPLRLDIGDTYTFFTSRTLQRTLKGASLELQSGIAKAGPRHSLVLLGGTPALPWRDVRFSRDLMLGSSWLADWTRSFSTSVNWLRDARAEAATSRQEERRQDVVSVAGEWVIREDHRLEVEYARLLESKEPFGGAPGRDVDAEAAQIFLSGHFGEPATYGLRLESASKDFLPAGSPFVSNHRVAEVTAGYEIAPGLQLRSRVQRLRDAWQTPNPYDTTLAGLTLSGELPGKLLGGLSTSLDGFIRGQRDRSGSFDVETRALSASVALAREAGWTPSVGLYVEDRASDPLPFLVRRVIDLRAGAEGGIHVLGLDGRLAPGLVVRDVKKKAGGDRDLYPEVRLTLARGRHSLSQSLGLLAQQPVGAPDGDLKSLSYLVGYRFRGRLLDIGLDLDAFARQPERGRESTSFRAALYVTRRFERQLGALPLAMRTGVTASKGLDLIDLPPDLAEATARNLLTAGGLVRSRQVRGLEVFRRTFYYEVLEDQSLVIDVRDGRLVRAAVLFEDFNDPDPARVEERFGRVRQVLIQRYGTPSEVFERGQAAADVVADIRRGTYVRAIEWRSPNGLLRLGIPRRTDGIARIELQHASSLPPLGDPGWSIVETSAEAAADPVLRAVASGGAAPSVTPATAVAVTADTSLRGSRQGSLAYDRIAFVGTGLDPAQYPKRPALAVCLLTPAATVKQARREIQARLDAAWLAGIDALIVVVSGNLPANLRIPTNSYVLVVPSSRLESLVGTSDVARLMRSPLPLVIETPGQIEFGRSNATKASAPAKSSAPASPVDSRAGLAPRLETHLSPIPTGHN